YARQVARGGGIRLRPAGAVRVAPLEHLRTVGDLSSYDRALARRDRAERAETPEIRQLLGRVRFEVPIRRAARLPDTVQVRVPVDALGTIGLRAGSGGDAERGGGGRGGQRLDSNMHLPVSSARVLVVVGSTE